MQSVLAAFPRWLVLGAAGGLLLSLLVAAVFLVGRRVYPDRPRNGPAQSGDARRRVEIRQYLTAIGEQYAEDHLVEGHAVAFYLPQRDVAITFDARAFYDIAGTRTHPVLVEHEMPGVHLGSRLPFDTPEVDLGPATDDRGVDDEAAFALLGLPAGASEDEVRAAYRERVKAVHPDHGGDPEQFRQLRDAYATARDRAAS